VEAGHSALTFPEGINEGKAGSLSHHSGGEVVFGDFNLEQRHSNRTSVFAKQF
jgi:hypothetical protein